MRYLALGDSISIDAYTGVARGGAASQLAELLGADDFMNLTQDGFTTADVLSDLPGDLAGVDVITLTAGGNDLLLGLRAGVILGNLDRIADLLSKARCPVIMNTVYDPTDGDDRLAPVVGLRIELRSEFDALKDGIRQIAVRHEFLLADLEALFRGHGINSQDCWFESLIEPNLSGATAIAKHWFSLLHDPGGSNR